MEISAAKRLAYALMREHLAPPPIWSLRFNESKRTFGSCELRAYEVMDKRSTPPVPLIIPGGVIILSRPLVKCNGIEEVRDTVLHEIAHALCGPGVGHSQLWQETAKRLGCRPEEYYDSTMVKKPPSRYIAECPKCGHQKEFNTIKVCSCGHCDNIYNPAYSMVFRENPALLRTKRRK